MSRTTSKERAEVIARLIQLGISYPDAEALRRIAGTLRNWFEYECGTGDDRVTLSIEREGENGDGEPFMRRQFMAGGKWQDIRTPIADREAGARKRLVAIAARYPALIPYIQGDCRGASVYMVHKPGIVEGDLHKWVEQNYSRGVAVY